MSGLLVGRPRESRSDGWSVLVYVSIVWVGGMSVRRAGVMLWPVILSIGHHRGQHAKTML